MDDAYPLGQEMLLEDHELVVDVAQGLLANDQYFGEICVVSTIPGGLDGTLQLDEVGEEGQFRFTPDEHFHGSTTFQYTMATTDSGTCPNSADDTGQVTITVTALNDPPMVVRAATCQNDVTVAEDSGPFIDSGACVQMVDFGPSDESNQSFDGWVVSSNHPELFAVAPSISQVAGLFGALAFTPAPNANGQATVTVQGRDTGGRDFGGEDLSAEVTVKIKITPANDAPTAQADSFTALPDRTLNVRKPGVLSNDSDIDDDALTASKVSDPAHGTVNLGSDGAFSYTPAAGYLGPDSFSYRASDGTVDSATRVVSINVTAISTPMPTAVPPTVAPTAGASAEATVEPPPSGSIEPSASIDPSASPGESAAATTLASLEPGATPAPEPAAGSGGPSIPVLVVVLLLLSMLTFGAAMYVPKWLERRRGVGPS